MTSFPSRCCAISADTRPALAGLPTKPCALCAAPACDSFRVGLRRYWQCPHCQLIGLDPGYYLSAQAEREEYLKHHNDPNDAGYRQFLRPALHALMAACPAPATVLDYGCGPGPALAHMLREAGYSTATYDPLFADQPAVLQRSYMAISCTEVAEHWQQPAQELQCLWSMLDPGGVLLIQTQPLLSRARFVHWQYRNDPTHVHFYAQRSFTIWAEQQQAELHFPTPAIALLRKPSDEPAQKHS